MTPATTVLFPQLLLDEVGGVIASRKKERPSRRGLGQSSYSRARSASSTRSRISMASPTLANTAPNPFLGFDIVVSRCEASRILEAWKTLREGLLPLAVHDRFEAALWVVRLLAGSYQAWPARSLGATPRLIQRFSAGPGRKIASAPHGGYSVPSEPPVASEPPEAIAPREPRVSIQPEIEDLDLPTLIGEPEPLL